MSCDMADKVTETQRNRQILRDLDPLALISSTAAAEALLADAAGGGGSRTSVRSVDAQALLGCLRGALVAADTDAPIADGLVHPESVLAYVYTGGTTKASKCVTVTHAMMLWEAENYSTALGGAAGPGDRMLQYSSLYWGAAVFGQLSVALALGACACIGGCPEGAGDTGCGRAGDALAEIVADVERFGITLLGLVPSQLRGAWPGGPATAPAQLRVLIMWADKCPVELSRTWRQGGLKMVDLLIASEYWLALYSDCSVHCDESGVEKHIYRPLPDLECLFLVEDESVGGGLRAALPGEAGEMYLFGPTTSPGYVYRDESNSSVARISLSAYGAQRSINGKMYLRTRDVLRMLPDGGLVYHGRADSMMKHGGQWVDVDSLQDAAMAVPGVAHAALLAGSSGVDAFVVLAADSSACDTEALSESRAKRPRVPVLAGSSPLSPPPFRTLAAVRKTLPAGARVHLRTELPLNPATAKVDRRNLEAQLRAVRDGRLQHERAQRAAERSHVRCLGAWLCVAVAFVLAPQALLALGDAMFVAWSGGDGIFRTTLSALLRLTTCGLFRLLVLPELWAVSLYMEHGFARGRGYGGAQRLRELARWLPLLLCALAPVGLLRVLLGVAAAYLAWAREKDAALVLGIGLVSAGGCAAALLPRAGTTTAAVGAALLCVAGRGGRLAELLRFLAAAPGLYYQLLPKVLSEALGDYAARLPFDVGLRPPTWKDSLSWDEKSAVVDSGNKWDRVYIEGLGGEREWKAIGIMVKLHWNLSDDVALAALLSEDQTPAADEGAASMVVDGPRNPLATLVERVRGHVGADLVGIDSMQAIQLTEAIRREFGKPLSVSDVLRCADFDALLARIESGAAAPEEAAVSLDAQKRAARAASERAAELKRAHQRRIWLCGVGANMCTVDWLACRRDATTHLDVEALRRAVDRLVRRHTALRAQTAEDLPLFQATYDAASLWQLWCASGEAWTQSQAGRLLSASIFGAWPRTSVLGADDHAARVPLLVPTAAEVLLEEASGELTDDQRAFWIGSIVLRRSPPKQLFQICVIPVPRREAVAAWTAAATAADVAKDLSAAALALTLSPEDVQWYIYAVLEHGLCDGPSGLPLYADLLRLYAEEAGEEQASDDVPSEEVMPDALGRLQERLKRSLLPLPDAEDANDDIYHDGLIYWGYRNGYQRFIRFDTRLMQLLRVASRDILGCSVDVAWLTIISAAFLRLFPALRRLDLFLIVTCRDRPGEERMIGYFSSRKMMPLEVGEARSLPLLGLADLISGVRRQRAWNRPRPFEKCGACIEVNIVSQAADGLPHGFQEVRCHRDPPRSWSRGNTSCMNLRLDQVARDDWDFRLQSWDAAYGQSWSTYYAQAMGSVLVDMALQPLGPVIP
eukprot:TRINITY_DN1279_c0_g4_i1.p1 TRINITY_DN1279_c0_g4~~TRINITY_DN1279_c0_g4_i1.p1  ORF type:complete len:1547 (-),score=373.59 TRINITY_DN1279_c0_g4_i1:258-4394(-)